MGLRNCPPRRCLAPQSSNITTIPSFTHRVHQSCPHSIAAVRFESAGVEQKSQLGQPSTHKTNIKPTNPSPPSPLRVVCGSRIPRVLVLIYFILFLVGFVSDMMALYEYVWWDAGASRCTPASAATTVGNEHSWRCFGTLYDAAEMRLAWKMEDWAVVFGGRQHVCALLSKPHSLCARGSPARLSFLLVFAGPRETLLCGTIAIAELAAGYPCFDGLEAHRMTLDGYVAGVQGLRERGQKTRLSIMSVMVYRGYWNVRGMWTQAPSFGGMTIPT